MSKQPTNDTFQPISWQSVSDNGAAGAPAGTNPGSGAGVNGFEGFSDNKAASADAEGFVSPYVSKEKLRELNADVQKTPSEEEIARQAYEKGFAQGEAAGMAAGQQQAQGLVERMQAILAEIEGLWQHLTGTYEKQIVDLVCRAAEKVVYGQVTVDQEVVKRAILNAFSVIPEPVGVTIEVNPADYEYIETIKEDFFSHIASLKDISVTADPSVACGGCNLRSRSGEVDASLETRLEAIKRSLIEANGKKS